MNAEVLKNRALVTLTSRTKPDDWRVKSDRPCALEAMVARPSFRTAPRDRRAVAEPCSLRPGRFERTPPIVGSRASILTRPVADSPSATTLADPLAEAIRLIGLADAQGMIVRLMGGLAFHARAPEWTARVERERRDIDLATRSRDRKAVAELLAASG